MSIWVLCEGCPGDVCDGCEGLLAGADVWVSGDRKVCVGCYADMTQDAGERQMSESDQDHMEGR